MSKQELDTSQPHLEMLANATEVISQDISQEAKGSRFQWLKAAASNVVWGACLAASCFVAIAEVHPDMRTLETEINQDAGLDDGTINIYQFISDYALGTKFLPNAIMETGDTDLMNEKLFGNPKMMEYYYGIDTAMVLSEADGGAKRIAVSDVVPVALDALKDVNNMNFDNAVLDNSNAIESDNDFVIRSRDSAFLPFQPEIDREHHYYTNVSVEGALAGSFKMEDATGIVFQPFEDAEQSPQQIEAYERYKETHSLYMAGKL